MELEAVIDTLAEEWEAIAGLCSALGAGEWDLPSECPGWSVQDVLSHLVGTERSLLNEDAPEPMSDSPPYVRNEMSAANEAWVRARRGRNGLESLAEFVEVTSRRLAKMRSWGPERFERLGPSPVGTVPYREFMNVRVMDCWVHEQDIRVATGRPGHRSGPSAHVAMDRLCAAMGFVVGKQAGAPDGVSVRFEVTGEVPRRLDLEVRRGRAVEVEDLVSPTATLGMDQEAFWRLACGRVDGEAAIAAGLVEIEGDPAIGRRVCESMGFMI